LASQLSGGPRGPADTSFREARITTTPLALIVAGSVLIGLISLGVAVLGSLLGQGHAPSLRVPLLVATAGYLVAIAIACVTLKDR